MSAPWAELGDLAGPAISQRRGAVVATAVAGTVLLVVGYGSGIGLVPASPGSLIAGPPAGEPPLTTPSSPLTPTTTIALSIGETGGDLRPTSLRLPPGPTPVHPWLPDGPAGIRVTPPTTQRPPTTPPPTSTPPLPPAAGCRGFVDGLLGALTTYLGGTTLDPALLRQVTAVLGLDPYLGNGRPLTDQLLAPLTPVLTVVPTTLDTLGLGLLNTATTTRLITNLRTLLNITQVVEGPTTVTDSLLRALLNDLLAGC